MFSHESEILRKVRLIESLKADLITNVGNLYHGIAQNSRQAIADGLAAVVVSAYILGKRLGIDFSALDEAVSAKVLQGIKQEQQAEKWVGDYSELKRHFRQKG